MYIFIIGNPGSGKDYICNHITQNTNIPYISGGKSAKTASKNDFNAQNMINDGKIANIYDTSNIIIDSLNCLIYNNIIFNGFPRTIDQAKYFFNKYKIEKSNIHFIYLNTSIENSIVRITQRKYCNYCYMLCDQDQCHLCLRKTSIRVDDQNKQSVIYRINLQNQLTQEILLYVKNNDIQLYDINANMSKSNVRDNILEYINKHQK